MTLTKRDLVMRISEETGLVQTQVFDVVQKTLDYIAESLAKGGKVELRNFGVFEVKIRKARVTVETQGICIQPEGTGVFDGADCGPIYLEFQNGKPVLYVWKDINGEDPVRIDLDGALESARREPLEV